MKVMLLFSCLFRLALFQLFGVRNDPGRTGLRRVSKWRTAGLQSITLYSNPRRVRVLWWAVSVDCDGHRIVRHRSHLPGGLAVLQAPRDAGRQGVGSRTVLHSLGRHLSVLCRHLHPTTASVNGKLCTAALPDRHLLHDRLLGSAHQNEPNLADLQRQQEIGEKTELPKPQIAADHLRLSDQRPADRLPAVDRLPNPTGHPSLSYPKR